MGIIKDEYKVGKLPSSAPQPGGTPPAVVKSPGYSPLQTNLPKKSSDGDQGFIASLINPFKKTAQNILGAGYEVARLAGTKLGAKNLYYDPNKGYQENPFKSKEELTAFDINKGKAILEQGIKPSVGVASWALPVTKGGLLMKTAASATLGAAQGFAESKPGEEAKAIAIGGTAGAVLGPVTHYGGRIVKGLATKVFSRFAPKAEVPLAEATKLAREKLASKGYAEIPQEINLAFYRQIPQSVKKVLGIGTKEIREELIKGGTIPTPPSLIRRLEQVQAGGSAASGKLTKFALRPAVEAVTGEAPKGIIATTKAGIQAVRTGIDETLKHIGYQSSKVIENQGAYGRVLAKAMRDTSDVSERRTGEALYKLQEALTPLASKADDEALVKFLDEGVTPKNKVVKEVGLKVRSMLEEVATEAQKLGIEQTELRGMGISKKGFTKLENYFPHIFTDRGMFDNAATRNKIIDKLVASGKAADRAEAVRLLDQFIKRNSPRRFGSLEFGRIADIEGYSKDPVEALGTYFDRAYRRLEEVKRFGQNNERARAIIDRIGQEGGDTDIVEKMFRRTHGVPEEITTRALKEKVLRGTGSAQVISKLGLGQLTNLGQTFNTIVKAGVRPTWAAIKAARTKGGQDFALRSSAILDAVLRDAQEQSGGTAATKFLKWTGFSSIEKMNRVVASNAGKFAADDALNAVINKGDDAAYRMLDKMGINVKKAVSRGFLNEQEALMAGQKMAEWTQFRVRPIDVPYLWSTPEGRFFTQFKNFAYKHAQFVKESVIDEAVKYHNFKPLGRLILFSQLIGEPLADVKALVRGKDITRKDLDSIPARMWDNFSTLGSFGIFYDMIQAAQYGRELEFLAGPTAGDVATLGGLVLRGDVEGLAKEAVRRLPVIGPAAKRILLPAKNQKKSTKLQPLAPLK